MRRPVLLALAGALSLPAASLVAVSAVAASPDVVISEVYGGGGNSGAAYTNDFVELYNRGQSAVEVTGWSVQYASASGSSWQVTELAGAVQPGGHFLVAEARGSGGTAPLPTPDVAGSIAMSASSGKVALVTDDGALTCGSDCHAADGVRDYVGYGSANDFEGTAAAPGLGNTTSDQRNAGGGDTDDNGADFTEGAPDPRSSGVQPVTARIHEIQGASHVSPLVGTAVSVPGIVTAVTRNELFLQDPQPDDDPATSEGIAVFTGRAPGVAIGDAVTAAGRVSEFRPGNAPTNLSTTEVTSSPEQVTVDSHGNPLPPVTLVGDGGRVPPNQVIEDDANGDVETTGAFDPAEDGLDFWETLEGMRVQMNDPVAVGPTSRFDELPIVADRGEDATPRSIHGGVVQTATDGNPERIIAADLFAPVPTADVGDVLSGAVVGIVDYDFGNFRLELSSTPAVVDGGLRREVTSPRRPGELSVATFNVENLAPDNPQAKFDGLAATVVDNLRSPDILALEEVQDDSGATDDGVVTADLTVAKLTAAIVDQGGPAYRWESIDPVNDEDGGQPGGNIRVGFLCRADRHIKFVRAPHGDATTAVDALRHGHGARVTLNPGRIDPANPAFDDSRKPLVGQFKWRGQDLFVIANHWNSKGGDDPLMGRFQPPELSSEAQRVGQAQAVAAFVDELLRVDPDAKAVLAGDLNDFPWGDAVQTLTGQTGLLDLPATLPVAQRFTYDFEGNSEVLDHILLSPELADGRYRYDVVHVNAEFADQLSDHDPQVVRLGLKHAG